jgi:hypothetical protein
VSDRWLWVALSRLWSDWRSSLVIVKPGTVVAWRRQGLRLYWTWESRQQISAEVREIIQKMSWANPLWGRTTNPRRTVKTGPRRFPSHSREVDGRQPPAAVAVLPNVSRQSLLATGFDRLLHRASDFLPVLFVFVVLGHDRRRVLHFNVTAHPTAAWTAQQILEAFPFETVPKYLLRDRDAIYDRTAVEAQQISLQLKQARRIHIGGYVLAARVLTLVLTAVIWFNAARHFAEREEQLIQQIDQNRLVLSELARKGAALKVRRDHKDSSKL